jgi:hypothetical protein
MFKLLTQKRSSTLLKHYGRVMKGPLFGHFVHLTSVKILDDREVLQI